MSEITFDRTDMEQMEALGITEEQVERQIGIFSKSSFCIQLERPCTSGDGIRKIGPEEAERYAGIGEEAAKKGRFAKFVPASGAATRMFQSVLEYYHRPPSLPEQNRSAEDKEGFPLECQFVRFVKEIRHFAFFDDLCAVMARDGLNLDGLLKDGNIQTILSYLLTDRGLCYGSLPKGLIKFHRYPSECRTPLDEHMVEGIGYLAGSSGKCDIHFTISPEHEERFRRTSADAAWNYADRFGIHNEVTFSFQKPSTNTIAVDFDNRPFRDRSGRLLFRPGGHGALLRNLNDLKRDLVYIKNIDNVVPERLQGVTGFWKRVTGGCLVETENMVHSAIRDLYELRSPEIVERVSRLAREKLSLHLPPDLETRPLEMRREFLLESLNRPIRVCGVVPNEGEPGGAPFWSRGKDGTLSLQIVESAQVDLTSPEQRDIWSSSTHFNPVDLVCALRNHEGKPFDLELYEDPGAVFISRKSKDGRGLKALELPGLWNGAMAKWITILVEVPGITFNPVKTTCDLLRPEHQPEPAEGESIDHHICSVRL